MDPIKIKEKTKKYGMKIVKYALLVIVILLFVISLISIFFCICEISYLPVALNKTGMIYLLAQFSGFNNLYASTIAMISVFYWIYQMDNMEKTNKRLLEETINKKKQNAVELSKYYHTSFQPIILEFYDLINEMEKDLLLIQDWNYDEFNDKSVKKNLHWVRWHRENKDKIRDKESAVIYELESLAANILYGDIEKEMMFKLIGKPFCDQVRVMFPFIAIYKNGNRETDYFENIPELFKKWYPKTNK